MLPLLAGRMSKSWLHLAVPPIPDSRDDIERSADAQGVFQDESVGFGAMVLLFGPSSTDSMKTYFFNGVSETAIPLAKSRRRYGRSEAPRSYSAEAGEHHYRAYFWSDEVLSGRGGEGGLWLGP